MSDVSSEATNLSSTLPRRLRRPRADAARRPNRLVLRRVLRSRLLAKLMAAQAGGRQPFGFDELILDTPKPMKRLAEFLEIEYTPKLAIPTFNEFPVGANSSFETSEVGVSKDPVDRYKDVLSDEQRAHISESCEGLYEEALALTEREVG